MRSKPPDLHQVGKEVASLEGRFDLVEPMVVIRNYRPSDGAKLMQLFYNTVHEVNIWDYSAEQVDAWAPKDMDKATWEKRFLDGRTTFVVEEQGQILGFAELESSGHIDCFYCHKECLGKGVGSMLLDSIESKAQNLRLSRLFTEASITAKPFFERKGFAVIKRQEVERRGIKLVNYVMRKDLG